jgi:hypothetical protein
MELAPHEEREVRAARNQALFRAVNEKMAKLNAAFAEAVGTFAIACECDDISCVQMIEIAPEEYWAVRAEPRRFVVRVDHVDRDVEVVVQQSPGYAVAEKIALAGETAERLASEAEASQASAGT